MKAHFTASMVWLHSWGALLPGYVLYFVFLTGTLGYFQMELDRWMRPELPLISAQVQPDQQMVAVAEDWLRQHAPTARAWSITLPDARQPHVRLTWQAKHGNGNVLFDTQRAQPIIPRDTGGGRVLYRMHHELHYMPAVVAHWIVGACTLLMLVALVTGVIIHKKIFADFFTFRPGKGQRSWLDLHNLGGVVALPFHLMITYSGLLFYAFLYMPMPLITHYGAGDQAQQVFFSEAFGPRPADASGQQADSVRLARLVPIAEAHWGPGSVYNIRVQHPDDQQARITVSGGPQDVDSHQTLRFDGVSGARLADDPALPAAGTVHDALLGLHEGLFAAPPLRWLYFLSGLLGTAMIATGLQLWVVKRRVRAPSAGQRLVERLNVGVLVGLPLAVAAYFWANRLLPGMVERAAWERHAMFTVWALALVHALWRAPKHAWIEQTAAAGALYLLLPLVNALTTHRHLGITLPQGDWMLAATDLSLLATGFGFLVTMRILQTRAPAAIGARTPRRAALASS